MDPGKEYVLKTDLIALLNAVVMEEKKFRH